MKKKIVALLITGVVFAGSCAAPAETKKDESTETSVSAVSSASVAYTGITESILPGNTEEGYLTISGADAWDIMKTADNYTIVDVREQYEYDEEHIEGAILIPFGSVDELAPELLPDKYEMLLIYCRSGRRSAIAAESFANLGYMNVYDFGGIIDWLYGTVTADDS